MRRPKKNIYKAGSLRVYNIINVPSQPLYYPVGTIDHAKQLIAALADSQLLDANIESNVFGLEVLEADGEWTEWENEEGQTIDEWGEVDE